MRKETAFCYRCGTEFTIKVTNRDRRESVGYGECPGCNKAGKFTLLKEKKVRLVADQNKAVRR